MVKICIWIEQVINRFFLNIGSGWQDWANFCQWRLFNLGSYLKITKVFHFLGLVYEFILTKIGWATFWVIFFADSSGHPAEDLQHRKLLHVSEYGPRYIIALTNDFFCSKLWSPRVSPDLGRSRLHICTSWLKATVGSCKCSDLAVRLNSSRCTLKVAALS
jgi:hypothetical protein